MVERMVDLQVGEAIEVGPVRLVVLDVDDDEVTFRIDSVDDTEAEPRIAKARLPR